MAAMTLIADSIPPYEVSDKKKGSTFLDLDFLIKDETSSLKGNLSDKKDVDFYNFSIPFNRTIQNYFGGSNIHGHAGRL